MYDPDTKGLIPRMFEYIFQKVAEADPAIEFNIKCSYLEIYMEKICDLLDGKLRLSQYDFRSSDMIVLNLSLSYVCAAKKTNLQVKDDKTRGLYV